MLRDYRRRPTREGRFDAKDSDGENVSWYWIVTQVVNGDIPAFGPALLSSYVGAGPRSVRLTDDDARTEPEGTEAVGWRPTRRSICHGNRSLSAKPEPSDVELS
ncbi:hypothetical protein [Halomicrococcus sp. NG-SE-24]|uniref:hypothetical protein n=1 Tax=Halomicrococcus sp. NG-SE-24 TaxID=3436928 RepID=UPI003D9701AD